MVRRKVLSYIFLTLCTTAAAQNGYKGKEFWLTFPQNAFPEDGSFKQSILITAPTNTNGVIEITSSGEKSEFTLDTSSKRTTFRSKAILIDTLNCAIKEGLHSATVHITSDSDIFVTALTHRAGSTETYQVLPCSKLGLEYAIVGYAPLRELFATQFDAIATQDSTSLTITFPPSSGFQPLTEDLNKGEALHYGGHYSEELPDLTGSILNANKPIAVICGHSCAQVPGDSSFCNVLMEMLPPTTDLGTKHIISKLSYRNFYSIRVVAITDETEVWIDSIRMSTINKGQYYQNDTIANNIVLTTSEKAYVMQFSQGSGSERRLGDPFMMLIAPTDKYINEVDFLSPMKDTWLHYVNIVTTSEGIKSLRLDRMPVSHRYFAQVGSSDFYAAQIEMGFGTHSLRCNEPMGVNLYGFGVEASLHDSYGHLCGMK